MLTPSYLQSEWTKYEYDVAIHRLIERKTRIVPILFQDINHMSNIKEGLRNLLKTVNYIEWPGSESPEERSAFWEKLQKAMPREKVSWPPPPPFICLDQYDFREPSSSLESSPYSTLTSRRVSYASSRQLSIRSVLSAMLTIKLSQCSTKLDTEKDESLPMQNKEQSRNINHAVNQTMEGTEEANEALEQVGDELSGSSMQLLARRTSAEEKLKIALPQIVIDSNYSPPTDVTCCTFV